MKISPLYRIISGFLSASKWNTNAARIETAFANTISRDGSAPNDMETNLDLGDNRIINVGAPVNLNDAVRLQDILDVTAGDFVVAADWDDIVDKPSTFPPSTHNQTASTITDLTEAVQDVVGVSVVGGSNITVTYSDATGQTTIDATGSLAGDWNTLTNKPATFTPSVHTQAFSTLTDGQEAVEDLIGTSILAGTNVTVAYNDGTGKTTISSSGGGSTPNMPLFTTTFGGVADGVTNNDAAFTSSEASAYEYIWLPEGNYYTTRLLSTFNKRYMGPGQIRYGSGGGSVGYFRRYATDVHPVEAPQLEYGLGENVQFSTAEYNIINAGTRKNFDRYLGSPGFSTYFWAPAIPHFSRLVNKGGWSGFSGATLTTVTAGVSTSCAVVGGTTGWQIGDVIGFSSAMDGLVTETRALTAVDTGLGTISWSGALTNTYPVGTTLSHGYRTMQADYMSVLDHSGAGDAYCFLGRINVNYTKLASQTAFEHTATGGLIGGDMTISGVGNYGTGWEMQYTDNAVSGTTAINNVASYIRTNNDGLYGSFWCHDLAKMDGGGSPLPGLKPLEGVWVAALAARTGLDLTRSKFSVAAVALPLLEKISFDAQISGAGPTNGNGWVATTDGGIYIFGNNVSGSKVLELQNNGARIRLGSGGINTNVGLNSAGNGAFAGNITSTSGYIHGVNGVSVNSGSRIWLDGPGGNTYITLNGATVQLVKGGSVVQSW